MKNFTCAPKAVADWSPSRTTPRHSTDHSWFWIETVMPPVRFAIVSPARWGRLLLDAARVSPRLEFAGAWSRSADNVAEVVAKYGGRAFATFEDLLAAEDVEAVVLPTPHFLHHPQAMAAFAAGKHVFVEKPIANALDEARDMQRMAIENGLVLAVGLQGRRTAGVRRAKELLDSGELGEPIMAIAVQSAPIAGNYRDGDWEIDPAKNPGGPLLNLGVHYMDVMQFLLGPIRRVSAFTSAALTPSPVPDVGVVAFEFASGVPGSYHTSQVGLYVSRLSIHLTRGVIHLNRFGQELLVEDPVDIREAQRGVTAIRAIPLEGPQPYTTALTEELDDFARCIREQEHPEVGAEAGIAALRPVLAALESQATGRTIDLLGQS